MINLTSLLR
jgi:hypothetical protein